jgi:DNA-binding response OmpR family regulator
MTAPTILIVDDEAALRESLSYAFRKESFEVLTAADAETGLDLARRSAPDLIVLDLILGNREGVDICRELRAESRVPIVMLTARDQLNDRLLGFDVGADDYVTKPFNTRELVARVRAVLRRERHARALLDENGALLERMGRIVGKHEVVPSAGPLSGQLPPFAGIALDSSAKTVEVAGRTVALSAAEYRLLEVLMAEGGRVVTRTELCRRIWGGFSQAMVALLDATFATLKEKIGDPPDQPGRLVAVPGIGLRLS